MFTSTFTHTMLNGRSYTQCYRCMLVMDELGYPDPEWYSPEWIANFMNRPAELRCNHNKTVTQENTTVKPTASYSYRVALGFSFIALMLLIMSAESILQHMHHQGTACCSSKICAQEKHHENKSSEAAN